MRAAVRDVYGPPDVVRVEEVDRPTPTDDEVLVRVVAASVNRADLDGLYPRWQFTRLFLGLRKPRMHRLGLDLSGVVEVVGSQVTRLKVGDEVFGDMSSFGQGAFADHVSVPERGLQLIPTGMSHEQAATLPHSAILALQALQRRDATTFGAPAKVMIVGASGNVGPFAIQIAKSRGAEVTAVARSEKLDFVRELGADHVIDYRTTDYTRTGERFDWIVDVDAHHHVLRWRRSLSPGGTYAALGGSGAWIVSALIEGLAAKIATDKTMGLMLSWKPFNPADVERLKQLVADGVVKPVIDRRYPLEEVVEALRYVDQGRARGKVIITF